MLGQSRADGFGDESEYNGFVPIQTTRDRPGFLRAWLLGVLSVGTALGACATVSPLSGAKTVPSGTSEVVIAVEALLPVDDTESGDNEVPVGLGPVFSYRRGLSDSVDASVRLYLIGVNADIRYALVQGAFSASVGAQVGASSVGVSIAGSNDDYSVTSFEVPLYLEYALSSSVSILAVPRAGVARFSDNGASNTSPLGLLAVGLPFKVGPARVFPSLTGGYYGNSKVVGSALGVAF